MRAAMRGRWGGRASTAGAGQVWWGQACSRQAGWCWRQATSPPAQFASQLAPGGGGGRKGCAGGAKGGGLGKPGAGIGNGICCCSFRPPPVVGAPARCAAPSWPPLPPARPDCKRRRFPLWSSATNCRAGVRAGGQTSPLPRPALGCDVAPMGQQARTGSHRRHGLGA
jgi:hypothetical protein